VTPRTPPLSQEDDRVVFRFDRMCDSALRSSQCGLFDRVHVITARKVLEGYFSLASIRRIRLLNLWSVWVCDPV